MVDLTVKEPGRTDYAVSCAGVSDLLPKLSLGLPTRPADGHPRIASNVSSYICRPKALCVFGSSQELIAGKYLGCYHAGFEAGYLQQNFDVNTRRAVFFIRAVMAAMAAQEEFLRPTISTL